METITEKTRYVRFKGVKVNIVDYAETRNAILSAVNGRGYVCLTCVWCVSTAMNDGAFLQAIEDSLLSVPDGTPLVWYARLLGCRKAERVSGPDLMGRMLEERSGLKHFLLGDTEQTIRRVIERARKANEGISISGYSPPFKERFSEADTRRIFDRIDRADPDLIWVSFGGGKQDKWMHRNLSRLRRGVMIGVGAAFRFYIGDLYTPPRIFQRLGLQWAFRLLQDPIRELEGHLQTDPAFILNFPREVLKNRCRPR